MYDVIVVGLGAIGAASIFELSQCKGKFLALDQYNPPHELGSSHGETRLIRKTSANPNIYGQLINFAYQNWKRLESISNKQLFFKSGALIIGKENSLHMKYCKMYEKNFSSSGINRTISSEEKISVLRKAKEFIPEIGNTIVKSSSCMYSKVSDSNFLIGKHPTLPNIYLAGAFNGQGYKYSSAIGQILAQLSIGKLPNTDISLFGLERLINKKNQI